MGDGVTVAGTEALRASRARGAGALLAPARGGRRRWRGGARWQRLRAKGCGEWVQPSRVVRVGTVLGFVWTARSNFNGQDFVAVRAARSGDPRGPHDLHRTVSDVRLHPVQLGG